MNKEAIDPKDFPFRIAFVRPMRRMLDESFAEGVHVYSSFQSIGEAIEKFCSDEITDMEINYYAEDKRLPFGPTTYIVMGKYSGQENKSPVAFISPGDQEAKKAELVNWLNQNYEHLKTDREARELLPTIEMIDEMLTSSAFDILDWFISYIDFTRCGCSIILTVIRSTAAFSFLLPSYVVNFHRGYNEIIAQGENPEEYLDGMEGYLKRCEQREQNK